MRPFNFQQSCAKRHTVPPGWRVEIANKLEPKAVQMISTNKGEETCN
jgi:hypothetical protein